MAGSVEGGGLQTTLFLAREIGSLSDPGHHPTNERKGWERVNVQVVPRMAKRILKDHLGIRDKGAVQLRVEASREEVERRGAPNTKKSSHHLRVERPFCPYNLTLMAEEISQDIELPWKIPRIQVDVETQRPPEKATG